MWRVKGGQAAYACVMVPVLPWGGPPMSSRRGVLKSRARLRWGDACLDSGHDLHDRSLFSLCHVRCGLGKLWPPSFSPRILRCHFACAAHTLPHSLPVPTLRTPRGDGPTRAIIKPSLQVVAIQGPGGWQELGPRWRRKGLERGGGRVCAVAACWHTRISARVASCMILSRCHLSHAGWSLLAEFSEICATADKWRVQTLIWGQKRDMGVAKCRRLQWQGLQQAACHASARSAQAPSRQQRRPGGACDKGGMPHRRRVGMVARRQWQTLPSAPRQQQTWTAAGDS
jgi:hypothetical protein